MTDAVNPVTCAVHGEKIVRIEEQVSDHEKRLRRLEAAWMKVAGATAGATVVAQLVMKLWLK